MSEAVVVIGAGSIRQAIARRVSAGKQVVLADLRRENADAAAEVMRDAGFDVNTATVDVSIPAGPVPARAPRVAGTGVGYTPVPDEHVLHHDAAASAISSAVLRAAAGAPSRCGARPVRRLCRHRRRASTRTSAGTAAPRSRGRVTTRRRRGTAPDSRRRRSRTGTRIQLKSGRKPVHQTTLRTSRTRPSSSTGRPRSTPTVRASDALDSRGEEVLLAVAEERPAAVPDVRAHLATHRRVDVEDVGADEHEHPESDPSAPALDRHGNLPGVGAREDDVV